MLRHACGSHLANKGQETRALQHYLGRKNIQPHAPLHSAVARSPPGLLWDDYSKVAASPRSAGLMSFSDERWKE